MTTGSACFALTRRGKGGQGGNYGSKVLLIIDQVADLASSFPLIYYTLVDKVRGFARLSLDVSLTMLKYFCPISGS